MKYPYDLDNMVKSQSSTYTSSVVPHVNQPTAVPESDIVEHTFDSNPVPGGGREGDTDKYAHLIPSLEWIEICVLLCLIPA